MVRAGLLNALYKIREVENHLKEQVTSLVMTGQKPMIDL